MVDDIDAVNRSEARSGTKSTNEHDHQSVLGFKTRSFLSKAW